MNRPLRITIVTQNLAHNLNQVKKFAKDQKVWAVVKANAYGHGIESCIKGFHLADGLALLDLIHVKELRRLGWTKKLLLLEGLFSQAEIPEVIEAGCDIVLHQIQQLDWLEQFVLTQTESGASLLKERVEIWLKLNSGMNRLGFKSAEYGVVYNHLNQMGFKVHHLTHFANADDLQNQIAPTVAQQWEVFGHTTRFMEGDRSSANSAALLNHSEVHADWVRPGIMLYGASPSGRFEDIASANLKPAMFLTSEIIAVQEIHCNDTVGYGSQFKATKNTRVGVVACGYADGYPRHAKEGTPVWVQANASEPGGIVGIIGRVSMDMLTIDLTSMPSVGVGASVELWGEHVPIDDVALASGTVGYELMCAIAPRVKFETI